MNNKKFQNIAEIISELNTNDNLILVYKSNQEYSLVGKSESITDALNNNLSENSFILVYLYNDSSLNYGSTNLMNASVVEPVQKLDEILRQVTGLFKKAGN